VEWSSRLQEQRSRKRARQLLCEQKVDEASEVQMIEEVFEHQGG